MSRRLAPLLLLLLASPVRAQEPVPIERGFTPDPVRISGAGGGDRSLRELGAGCDGYIASEPTRVLELQDDFSFLRLFAVSSATITLALRGTDGRWRCGGQRIGPAVMEEGSFGPGRLEVYVGGPEPGVRVGFDLSVTEFRSVGPSVGGGPEANVGLTLDAEEGRFRGRRLRRGFLPDPREDGGTATGVLDIRSVGPECRGFVQSDPSHLLTLRTDFDYFRVQLGDAAGRATLMVRTPGGRYLCSSPDERNAFVDQDAWTEGDYLVWVGARERTETVSYRICYTEVRPAEGTVYCGRDRMGARTRSPSRRRAADSEESTRPDEADDEDED